MPRNDLRAGVLTAMVGGLVAVIGLSAVAWAFLPLSAGYPLKASAAFVIPMLVAVAFLESHHPFNEYGPGNQTTTARAVLVALVAGAIGEPASPVVAVYLVSIALLATGLDGLDGLLARRSGTASAFGARFDMELDALLIMVLAVLAWRLDKAGPWVLWSGLLRYFFVAGGLLFAWLRKPLPRSRRRQSVCVIQVVGLILVMAPAVTPPLSVAISALGLALLAVSFAVDAVWLWRTADMSTAAHYVTPSLGHRR